MKVLIRPYGDDGLEIDGCVFRSRESVERFAANVIALAKRVWPDKKKEKTK